MFVTTYLVAVCFAARNKKDMVEGGFFFFAGQFVLFLIGKNSYSSFKSNFFFILCYQLYTKEISSR